MVPRSSKLASIKARRQQESSASRLQEGLHRRSSITAKESDRKCHHRSIKISSTGASLQVIGEAPSRDKLELRLSKLNCEINLCFNEVKVQVDDRGVLT